MILDYHMHTPLCRHAVGAPEEYARRAVERGIEEIGFSDHSPMPATYDPEYRMRIDEYAEYVEMVSRCRTAVPGLSIKLGLEADYHPGTDAFVREVIGRYAFDYVIGSVHYLGSWGFDNPDLVHFYEQKDVYELYREYYGLIVKLAETRMYDIVGHPDVIKKFGHRPAESIDDLLRPALAAVRKAGMAMEINTSGLRRPCKEIYPSRRMVEIAFELGVPVTLGSDAHRPHEVGEGFDEAAGMLRSVGYTSILRFTRRRAEAVPL